MDTDVNFICKIDRELYRVVDQDLVTDDVIITEQQILHIEDGHPGDYDRLSSHIPLILQEPDYILRGNRRILLWYSKKLSRLNLPLKSSCG